MLSKKYRLRARDFSGSLRTIFKNPLFSVRIRKNNLSHTRFAVVVSLHVDKRATARNRLRRIVFNELSTWHKSGYDVMVVVSPAARNAADSAIRQAVRAAREIVASLPL